MDIMQTTALSIADDVMVQLTGYGEKVLLDHFEGRFAPTLNDDGEVVKTSRMHAVEHLELCYPCIEKQWRKFPLFDLMDVFGGYAYPAVGKSLFHGDLVRIVLK